MEREESAQRERMTFEEESQNQEEDLGMEGMEAANLDQMMEREGLVQSSIEAMYSAQDEGSSDHDWQLYEDLHTSLILKETQDRLDRERKGKWANVHEKPHHNKQM
jgi:hypothetical protein